MAGPVKYLSGRQDKLKIGIPDYNQETTTLQVFGRVGVGTTNATSDLYVKGGAEFTGIVTATKFDGALEDVVLSGISTLGITSITVLETQTLNITGISTFRDIVNLLGATGITSVSFTPTSNTVKFLDNSKAVFGDGSDLQIFHDGEKSIISDNGTGELLIRGENLIEFANLVGEKYLRLNNDGATELYFDNVEQLKTTGYGVTVNGTTGTRQIQVSGVSTFVGAVDIEDSIDIDGLANLDTVNISGVSTFGGAVDINADVNLDDNTLNVNYGSSAQSDSLVRINTVNRDIDIIRLSGSQNDISLNNGDYGFNLKYLGTRDGNKKTISFITDNQTSSNQVEALSILQDGKVGIGTSLATQVLDVYGTTRTTNLNVTKTATFAGVSVSDELGGSLTVTGIATFGDTIYVGEYLYHKDDTDTYIKYDTDRVRIVAGNEELLDIFEGVQDYVKLGDGGDVDINLNDALHVDGLTKNVGVGTTTIPSQQLDVDGNVRLQGALYDKNNQAGTNGQVLISTGDGIDWVDGAPTSAITGITIKDEGVQQGVLGSITQLDFVGTGVAANASGSISTVTVTQATPGGANHNVQFNNSGAFDGATGLNYDDATGRVGVGTFTMDRTLTVSGQAGISSNVYGFRFFATEYTPSAANELVTKNYLDNFQSSITVQKAVSAATTANIVGAYDNGSSGVGAKLYGNTNAALVVDGYASLGFDDRVLVKDQTNKAHNGIYTVNRVGSGSTNFELIRAATYDSDAEIAPGDFTFISNGTLNQGTGWVHITTGNVSIGSSILEWTQFTAPTTTLAGAGLINPNPNELAVATASADRIVVNANDIDLATVATSKSDVTTGDTSFVTEINVDGYGRVTGVITSNIHSDATTSAKGIVKIDDTNLTVSSGIVSVTMAPKLTGLSVSGVSTIGITTTDVLHAKTFSSAGIVTTRGGLDLKGKLYDSLDQVGTTTSILASTGIGVSWALIEEIALQGRQGIQGLQGNQGIQGIQGIQGSQGTQGRQGIQGIQGRQGTQGTQGTQGRQGRQGLQGRQGYQGLQ